VDTKLIPDLSIDRQTFLNLVPCETYPQFRVGHGMATAHHGELFQGVVQEPGGQLHRSLVSLPCKVFKSSATFTATENSEVIVDPTWKVKSRRAVDVALAYCGLEKWGGCLRISSNIPVGWGLGSSTSDVTAAIRATVDAFRRSLSQEEIASLAVKAELASDPVMFGKRVVLFAHREGRVLEELGEDTPDLEILGFNPDPTGAGIDTLAFAPARYSWWEIEAFRPMLSLLRRGIQAQHPRLIGRVASASAEINQKYLPKPHFDRLKAIARTAGAAGFQVAHSGTTVGLLFDPNDPKAQRGIQRAQDLLAEIGITQTWHFHTKET
jgi:uncharacterized protein involved in propanediol utilization